MTLTKSEFWKSCVFGKLIFSGIASAVFMEVLTAYASMVLNGNLKSLWQRHSK